MADRVAESIIDVPLSADLGASPALLLRLVHLANGDFMASIASGLGASDSLLMICFDRWRVDPEGDIWLGRTCVRALSEAARNQVVVWLSVLERGGRDE